MVSGMASDLIGLDASWPFHSNYRVVEVDSIPKDRWNVVRFWVESTGHQGACPIRRLAWSARSLLTTAGTAFDLTFCQANATGSAETDRRTSLWWVDRWQLC